MSGRVMTSIVAVVAVGALAVGSALAPAASTTTVKTGQKANKLRIGKFEAVGQIKTAGGDRKARKRCLKNRVISLKGPPTAFGRTATDSRAARLFDLGTDKTNAKGEWSISPPPDALFGAGLYVVKVKQKTVGGTKKGQQLTRCRSHKKKVTRTV